MKILGFLGSPRLNGNCSKLLGKALDGAESAGAETKLFELINYTIMDCRGCSNCFLNNPDLLFGSQERDSIKEGRKLICLERVQVIPAILC